MAAISLGMGNCQDDAFHHTDHYKSLLATIFTIIQPLNGEGIAKDCLGEIEADAVISFVFNGFGIVPVELGVLHVLITRRISRRNRVDRERLPDVAVCV